LTKFCDSCGQELLDSDRFCQRCGTTQPTRPLRPEAYRRVTEPVPKTELEAKIGDLEARLAGSVPKEEAGTLRARLKELESIVAVSIPRREAETELETATRKLRGEIEQLKEKLAAPLPRVKVQTAKAELLDKVRKLEARLAESVPRGEAERLDAEIGGLEKKLAASKSEGGSLHAKIEQLQDRLAESVSKAESEAKVNELEAKLSVERRETEVARKKIEDLEGQLSESSPKIDELQDKLSRSLGIENLTRDKNKLSKRIQELEAELARSVPRNELEATRSENENLRNEILKLRTDKARSEVIIQKTVELGPFRRTPDSNLEPSEGPAQMLAEGVIANRSVKGRLKGYTASMKALVQSKFTKSRMDALKNNLKHAGKVAGRWLYSILLIARLEIDRQLSRTPVTNSIDVSANSDAPSVIQESTPPTAVRGPGRLPESHPISQYLDPGEHLLFSSEMAEIIEHESGTLKFAKALEAGTAQALGKERTTRPTKIGWGSLAITDRRIYIASTRGLFSKHLWITLEAIYDTTYAKQRIGNVQANNAAIRDQAKSVSFFSRGKFMSNEGYQSHLNVLTSASLEKGLLGREHLRLKVYRVYVDEDLRKQMRFQTRLFGAKWVRRVNETSWELRIKRPLSVPAAAALLGMTLTGTLAPLAAIVAHYKTKATISYEPLLEILRVKAQELSELTKELEDGVLSSDSEHSWHERRQGLEPDDSSGFSAREKTIVQVPIETEEQEKQAKATDATKKKKDHKRLYSAVIAALYCLLLFYIFTHLNDPIAIVLLLLIGVGSGVIAAAYNRTKPRELELRET